MLKGALITGMVVVGTVATVAVLSGEDPVTVIRVIDGDTIDARVDGEEKRIRLLNVDTPEYGRDGAADDCLAEEATAYLRSLLPSGQEISLQYDSERTDHYGRDLAGVVVDGSLINAEIAREGYGVAVQVGGNDRFMPEVSAAEAEAKAAQRGVHGLPDECLVSVQTATAVAQAAPLLAAGVTAMSRADLDLHEKKLRTALSEVRKVRKLALHPSEFAEHAYDGHRAERKELNNVAAELEQRVSEVGERRVQIEREVEEERRRIEQERIEAEHRAVEEERRRIEQERAATAAVPSAPAPSSPAASQPAAPSGGGGGGKYTGCRAYGGNYAMTSIDDKGRRYAKIDCVTKTQIG